MKLVRSKVPSDLIISSPTFIFKVNINQEYPILDEYLKALKRTIIHHKKVWLSKEKLKPIIQRPKLTNRFTDCPLTDPVSSIQSLSPL